MPKHHKAATRRYVEPPPVIPHSQFSLRMPTTLDASIRQYAKDTGVSVNRVICDVLMEAF